MKNNSEIKNWKDYLEMKFSDQTIYTINDATDVLSNGTYSITAKGSETEICFIWPDEDWLTIDDIQFYDTKVRSWSGELLGGNGPKKGRFNQKNIEYVNLVLETPIKKGWTSTDYFFFGKIFKSVTKEGINPDAGLVIFTDYNLGCFGIILFPISLLIDFGVSTGLIGKKKISIVKPMIQ
ncbi:hypothetical protein [Bizionia psychrotolerans]|uniref:hypothetical protein n=1 Tax=Bizionia psychrotolerans TaxID=1492901 RepID=UPI0012E025D3|nr:hypothetical protein [Bizionia psychrotolerans]